MHRSQHRKKHPLKTVFTLFLFVLIYAIVTMTIAQSFRRLTTSKSKEKDTVEVFQDLDGSGTSPQRIVVLDAGHGGEDNGTTSKSGIKEKELNLSLTFLLADHLRMSGIKVIFTRDSDRLLYDPSSDYEGRKKVLDLRTRAEIAERVALEYPSSEILFISIHMNSFPLESAKGLQVWYSPNDELHSSSLAEMIQLTVKALLQPDNNRKIKEAGTNIYLLDRIEIPAVLVECGFLSNESEATLLNDPQYRKKLALSLFCAITDYFTKSNSPSNQAQ